jgi:hypothetical protein
MYSGKIVVPPGGGGLGKLVTIEIMRKCAFYQYGTRKRFIHANPYFVIFFLINFHRMQ